ncbi:translation initiation factor IF-2-like [Myiozetetes cayanensis]|uniref:translation initiation factor IF-2-like n=1 Tax=Myiozetetes cayanensis TaxID=478635 RepID=UPI002160879E|nr:translation initiation factor IF-2-like [Myiozetetes cayanensis]
MKAALTASASGGLQRGAAQGSRSGRPAFPAASATSSRSRCLSLRPGAAPAPQPRHDPAASRKAKPLGGETRHLLHPAARRGVCAGAEGPRPRRTERCPPGPGAAGSSPRRSSSS